LAAANDRACAERAESPTIQRVLLENRFGAYGGAPLVTGPNGSLTVNPSQQKLDQTKVSIFSSLFVDPQFLKLALVSHKKATNQ
jgi:hypothetical protein